MAIGALIFAGGLTFFLEAEKLGMLLVILGLAIAVPVLFEGTYTVRRSLVGVRNVVQKTAERTSGISNIARSSDLIEKRVGLTAASLAEVVAASSQPKPATVTESPLPLEQIRDWVGMTRHSVGRNVSIAAASGLFESLSRHMPTTAVHIGSGTSTAWVANCLAHLQPRPCQIVGLVETESEVEAFGLVAGAASSDDSVSCRILPSSPAAAASLSGISAHSTDMVLIDYGGLTSGTVLTDCIPALYFRWLRPKTPVVIVDSAGIDVRPAVQSFLEVHSSFYVKYISKSYNYAELIGA
ncbi:hypothetical protein [Arthrobacter sp. fls2-241-R2A-200]|uniref:hypothetical protein n=1 Tax=Arthrobacter sp. fls2-241-R2A-200 TaxID=3040281 RepID=UPI00254F4287|nr:hypothetical protein [Arthrobacter sp. fls2-241-R2A-200]